ncbi:TPA: hypothetical protein N0F65_007829 [Lagenidium giganteum]|uniref:Uncharacterized protein n=1 Tax=Lagenidium giganteum TaxID=4803 RepID=A0AAV2Z2D7_9STRA|nr:TPA: hypothetical protein N0F65_007829 [Lagenidium giganteum]
MVVILAETAILMLGHASSKMEHCTMCTCWLSHFETDTQTSTMKRLWFNC